MTKKFRKSSGQVHAFKFNQFDKKKSEDCFILLNTIRLLIFEGGMDQKHENFKTNYGIDVDVTGTESD